MKVSVPFLKSVSLFLKENKKALMYDKAISNGLIPGLTAIIGLLIVVIKKIKRKKKIYIRSKTCMIIYFTMVALQYGVCF